MRSGVVGGVGLWDMWFVCVCIKDFYLVVLVFLVYFLCCWLCFMVLGFILLFGLMNLLLLGCMEWCW